MDIEGDYRFTIQKKDGWYLATCYLGEEEVGTTQGRTEWEIFTMIADLFATMQEIPAPLYLRLWWKVSHPILFLQMWWWKKTL